jgi:hypothetical protein
MYDQWITLCPRNRRKWEPVTWEQILGKSYMQKGYKASVEQGAPHSAQTYLPHIIKRQARTYRCMACPSPEPRGDVQYYICCLPQRVRIRVIITTRTGQNQAFARVILGQILIAPIYQESRQDEVLQKDTNPSPDPTITAAPPNSVEDRVGCATQR